MKTLMEKDLMNYKEKERGKDGEGIKRFKKTQQPMTMHGVI